MNTHNKAILWTRRTVGTFGAVEVGEELATNCRTVIRLNVENTNELKIEEHPTKNRLYAVSGTKWGNEWKYVVEPETGILWVEIIYD